MRKLLKFSPLLRAVGVIGVVAGLVSAVTFAQLTSNTVTLTNNTLTSATAALQISNDNSTYGSTAPGMSFTTLTPGVQSSAFTFFVKNNGDVPLNITTHIPGDFTGSSIPADQVTLTINCGGGDLTKTIADLNASAWTIPGSPLANANTWTCTAKALLNSSFSGSGSVTPFNMDFVGTQVTI
ncbi:MAG: hypothetical protein JWS12_11 [Candidatus Saccharibacteria bacterium]|nr:hypothetical protein [Candidatus Saccharibacteria bacterium]